MNLLRFFVLAPGAFFVLACLVALQNKVKANLEKKGKKFRYRQDAAKVALHVQAKESAEVISQENEPHHEETNVKEEEEA